MKKATCIVGVGLIIGGVAIAIYLLSSKKKEKRAQAKDQKRKWQDANS